jgi:DNA-binding MarR family transcriptional regulator
MPAVTAKDVKLSIGGAVHDPNDPVGRLRGKQPKLSVAQQKHLIEVHKAGLHRSAELAELFNVARSTVYRTIQRQFESGR